MRTFRLSEHENIVCESQPTRSGFRHVAVLLRDGSEIHRTKVCYLNRTWESFEFETVLAKLLEKAGITKEKREAFFFREQNESHERMNHTFKMTGMVASLGDLFGQTTKEKNDWKSRMLKTGLPGLDIPEDWSNLDEKEKENRLNKIIEITKATR